MPRHVPTYRHHKASGRAVVQWKPFFGDNPHYLPGKFKSPESLAAWGAIWRRFEEESRAKPSKPKAVGFITTVFQLLSTYYDAAKHQLNAGHRSGVKKAIDIAIVKFAKHPVDEFGPVALEECRDEMVSRGWSRRYINREVGRIRKAFKWGVSRQYVRPETYGALALLEGLKKGWTSAPERKKVKPASRDAVDRLMPFLSSQVADMVELQWLAGMRSGELVSMKADEINIKVTPWEYRPPEHKNSWRDKERVIYFGPRARKILKRYLRKAGYLFKPAASLEEQLVKRMSPKSIRLPKIRDDVREFYSTASYQRSIVYGFIRLGLSLGIKKRPVKGQGIKKWLAAKDVEYFYPHQLRHSRATLAREEYGIEGARALLQNTFDATLIYAEDDAVLARRIATATG